MKRNLPVMTVILAGGRGSRMGGDKGLVDLGGRPLIGWVIGVLRNQGAGIVISANENLAAYAELGYPVVKDEVEGYAGPLAGLQAAVQHGGSEWVASVPCDTPFLPNNLVERLLAAADGADAAVAVAGRERQPVIAVYRRSLAPRLRAFLDHGQRKVGDWLDTLQTREAVFEDEAAFVNINSGEELQAANRLLQRSDRSAVGRKDECAER